MPRRPSRLDRFDYLCRGVCHRASISFHGLRTYDDATEACCQRLRSHSLEGVDQSLADNGSRLWILAGDQAPVDDQLRLPRVG